MKLVAGIVLAALSMVGLAQPNKIIKPAPNAVAFPKTTLLSAAAPALAKARVIKPSTVVTSPPAAPGAVLGTTTDSVVTQSQLQSAIDQASNALRLLINVNAGTIGEGQYSTGGITNNIALSNRIDHLNGTTLTNVVVDGVQGLAAADIPDLSSKYLTVEGAGNAANGIFSSNVGIGTTSPTALLTVDSTSTTGTIIRISNSSTGGHVYDFLETGSSSRGGAGRLDFFDKTIGVARLSIAANGNVGIGTTSPFANFAVAGNAYLSGNLNVGDASTTRTNLGLSYASSANIAAVQGIQIAAWGDSLTNGHGGGGTSYGTDLEGLSGFTVLNYGEDGDTSTLIAARMLAAPGAWGLPTIIWAGYNNYSSPAQVESDIAAMVSNLQSVGNSNYIILSVVNGSNEPSGGANYNNIISINSSLAATYPNNYLDARSYLVSLYNPNSPQDVTDHTNDEVPTSLRSGTIHLNAAGYADLASYIYAHLNILLLVPVSNPQVLTVANASQLIDPTIGLKQNGTIVLNASSTNQSLNVGLYAGSTLLSNGVQNVAVGYQSLYLDSTGSTNSALGYQSLYNNTASNNSALGYQSLFTNTTGTGNSAFGHQSLFSNTSGSTDSALGKFSLFNNTTGFSNTAIGYTAMLSNTTGSTNVAVGVGALSGNGSATTSVAIGFNAGAGSGLYSNQGGTYVGWQSGKNASTGSDFNTFLGYQAGFDNTTGTDNIIIGPAVNSGGSHLKTGSNNILLGFNANTSTTTQNNFLNIGRILFGILPATTSATTLSTPSTGSIGIGTTTPYSRLTVWGSDNASSTSSFSVVSLASTTLFSVFNGGNAQLSGTLTQSSDQRLKTSIMSLDASSSLAAINALTPVTYNWLDPQKGGARQYGFIAQQVQQVFPELVSTTSPTALTPDGTLGLNYLGLIAPLVEAVQSLSKTVAGFAESFTSQKITASQELCVGATCVTETQLQGLLVGEPSVQISAPTLPELSGTPPSIDLQGSNPATVNVGNDFIDLGAIVTDNQGNSLGYKTFLNGTLVSNIIIDTTRAATDTIEYVATDTWGNTSTSTRTVLIEANSNS